MAPTKDEVISKLEAFRTAALELSEIWEQLDSENLAVADDLLTFRYPFDNAFEEVSHDISVWCTNAVEALKK